MKELDQTALQKGQSRKTGGDRISPNRKLFLISFIYIKKNVFFQKVRF